MFTGLLLASLIPSAAGEPVIKDLIGPDGRVRLKSVIMKYPKTVNWPEAMKICTDLGLDMGTPWSAEDNSAMVELFKGVATKCWIGVSDVAVLHEWRYISGGRDGLMFWLGLFDGYPQNGYYSKWFSTQPSDGYPREDVAELYASGEWNDVTSSASRPCAMCEAPRLDPTNTLTQTLTISEVLTLSGSHSDTLMATVTVSGSRSLLMSATDTVPATATVSIPPTPTESYSLSPSLTPSATVSETLSRSESSSLLPTPTESIALLPTPSVSITPYYPAGNQCPEVNTTIQPTMIDANDLFANGVEFVFTVVLPLDSHVDEFVPLAEALLEGMGNATAKLASKCNITASNGVIGHYRCRFPPTPAATESVRTIMLRYTPSPKVWCPLGFADVIHPWMRGIGVNDESSPTPVCLVVTNALSDGSVFVLLAGSLCAPPSSRQGTKVAMYIIAPLSPLGHSAAVFGNIDLTVVLWIVGYAILHVCKSAGWKVITQHPIIQDKAGFRATLFGMWFWLADLTYPGVVVGTFGLIREGGGINTILGALGSVYLVLIPVMAVVIVGPLRSPLVTYKEVDGGDLVPRYGICSSLFIPLGMWGGTGPALGPVTQPFAGIHKAVWYAPLSYAVLVVFGALLHATDQDPSCVHRLVLAAILLVILSVTVAVTRPFRYPINSLLYTVTFGLLAVYAVLLTITASRQGEHSDEHDSGHVMGFSQLAIGVSLCVMFLMRGAVFVVILIKEGSQNTRRKSKIHLDCDVL